MVRLLQRGCQTPFGGSAVAKAASRKAKSGKTSSRKTVKRSRTKPAAKRAARKATKATKTRNAARAAAGRRAAKASPPKKTATGSAAAIARGVGAIAVAAVVKYLPWSKDQNDPIRLLESDHRQFERLLDEGAATTERAVKGRTD